MIKNILFDLDGTLLKFDMNEFTKIYFGELAKVLVPYGYAPEHTIAGVWSGIKAMAMSDGSMRNDDTFWKAFEAKLGGDMSAVRATCDNFYKTDFHKVRAITTPQPLAKEAIKIAREKGMKVVLATSPVFPRVGVEARLEWAGLAWDDFDYVTTYETEYASKPNPLFYTLLIEKLGMKKEECLMVGNDEKEDMLACTLAGIDGYLTTDCLLEDKEHPFSGKRGTFAEFVEYLKSLQ